MLLIGSYCMYIHMEIFTLVSGMEKYMTKCGRVLNAIILFFFVEP